MTPNLRFDVLAIPDPLPVGARLLNFAREWSRLTTDSYVRSVVREGYHIELESLPTLSPVPLPMQLSPISEKARCLRREITSLLEKRAIEELCPTSLSPGFYSRIFLVPKKDGGRRPVFDLKALNHFVRKEKFKMTTPRVVTNALHHGDWAVSVDLKDAYFHMPIHRKSRRLLRFATAGNDGLRVFQFRALPFGLTSAPRVFTKVILPIGHLAHTCDLSSAVSRRLDTEKYRQVTTGSADKLVATYHAPGRTGAKCAKVAVSTNQMLDTHRRRVLARCRANVPADGQGSQDRKRSVSTSIRASDDSELLAVPPWTYELGNGCHPLGEIASQTPAALLARSLVPSIERYGGTDTSETQLTRSPSSLVVEQEVHTSRNVPGHSGGSDAVVHRLVGVGLGSQFRHFPGERRMVGEGGYSPCQSTGNASGTQCVGSIQDTIVRPNGSIDVRQRDRCVIHSEARWDILRTNVSASKGSAPSSTGCEYLPSGQAHSGRTECTSGPSLQNEQSGPHGVDITPIRRGCTQHHLGHTQCGSVCDSTQQQIRCVCFPHGRPPSGRSRRHVDLMERDVCICISPVRDVGASNREITQGSSLRNDPDRPEMAQSVMVRQTDRAAGRLSFGPAPQERSLDTAPQPPETSVATSSAPTRLETVQRSLQAKGFSRAVAEQISRGRRQSSRAVYDSKWRIFSVWCGERSVDPLKVSVQQRAEFLLYLFHEKGLNPRTITVNNLSGFASLFANQCQPPANQCDIWFADTANQNMDQGTGLEVRC